MLLSIVHDREVLCDEPPPGAEKCTRTMDWRLSSIEQRQVISVDVLPLFLFFFNVLSIEKIT